MLKAVFFGSLSSLTDLTDLERQAFNRAFETHAVPLHWSETAYRELLQRNGRFGAVDPVFQAIEGRDPEVFFGDVEQIFRDLIDETELTLRPWTAQAIDNLRGRRVALGLISGAERQTINRVLAALFGQVASGAFRIITSVELCPMPKPAPDLYQTALDALNCRGDEAIVLETTRDGVAAAKAAKAFTVAYPGRYHRAEDLSAADCVRGADISETISRFYAAKLPRGGAGTQVRACA